MDPEVRKAFRENIEFRRAWNALNVERGGAASADELRDLAVKFGVQKPKPNFNAGLKARTQKPGNPFDAKNFKSHDYDFNAKAKYWEDARRKRWENFHAEADRMKSDFEAKFKAQQQAKPKWNFHKADPEFVKNMGNNVQKDYMRDARRGMAGLGLAGAAYGGYKLYDYYKNRNKKAA